MPVKDLIWKIDYRQTAAWLRGSIVKDGWAVTKGNLKTTITSAIKNTGLFAAGELDALLDSVN